MGLNDWVAMCNRNALEAQRIKRQVEERGLISGGFNTVLLNGRVYDDHFDKMTKEEQDQVKINELIHLDWIMHDLRHDWNFELPTPCFYHDHGPKYEELVRQTLERLYINGDKIFTSSSLYSAKEKLEKARKHFSEIINDINRRKFYYF